MVPPKLYHVMIFALPFVFETASEKTASEGSLSESPPRLNIPKPRISMSTLNAINSLLPPHPTAWPTQFSIMFLSNFSSFPDAERFDHSHAVKGHFSYSEANGLRISHGPGSYECQKSFHSNEGCSLQLQENQVYVKYHTSGERVCCVNMERQSALNSDWVTHGFQFNSTRRIMSRMCHGFRREGNNFEKFTYWADSVTKLPCAVSFDFEPRLDWYFIPVSLKLDSDFLAPSLKDSRDCHKPCGRTVTTSLNLFSQ
jgi:hypothetical protein